MDYTCNPFSISVVKSIKPWSGKIAPQYKIKVRPRRSKLMYIDPSTGGVLFQALAGVFIAASGVILVFSRKIREGIAKLRRKSRKDEEEE